MVRIHIAPLLRTPESLWAWREILTSAGTSWEETEEATADIIYSPTKPCLNFQAHWNEPNIRLDGKTDWNGLNLPRYENTPPRDLIFDFFWLLSGQEEARLSRDKHARPIIKNSTLDKTGLLQHGTAGHIVTFISKQLTTDLKPKWPGGYKAAAGVGHDVDYPEAVRWLEPLRIVKRQGIAKGLGPAAALLFGKRTHWHFDSWIKAESEIGFQSAFYFVPRAGSLIQYAAGTPDPFYDVRKPRFKELFQSLKETGTEIGMHASYRCSEDRDTFVEQRGRLQEASDSPVPGNRHHYWRIATDYPEDTLLAHEKAGFLYDSSLTFENRVGWRRGTSIPFHPFHLNEKRPIQTLQICTGWMDDHLFGHKQDNPGDRDELLDNLASVTIRDGGCFLIDVHDYVYDDRLFPGWSKTYLSLMKRLKDRGDVWLATPSTIADHWTRRKKEIIGASKGLS